jgi:hypothetical protein
MLHKFTCSGAYNRNFDNAVVFSIELAPLILGHAPPLVLTDYFKDTFVDDGEGKSLLHPLNYGVDYLTPSTMKRSILPSELSKTGQITLQADLKRRICYSNHCIATVTTDLLQIVDRFIVEGVQ